MGLSLLPITIGFLTKYEGTQRKIEMGYQYKVPYGPNLPLSFSVTILSIYLSSGAHRQGHNLTAIGEGIVPSQGKVLFWGEV